MDLKEPTMKRSERSRLMQRALNRDALFVAFFAALCVGLYLLPLGFQGAPSLAGHRARARVVAVDDSDVMQHQIVRTGNQVLTVELLDGPYAGQRSTATNHLYGKMEQDEIYATGDTALVEFSVKNGKVHWAHARGHYRLNLVWALVGLFAVLLLSVAGWTGLKAMLSFVFTALVLWKVMIPSFLRGHDPIVVGLAVVALLTAATSFLVGGLTRKGAITFLGAFLGLLLTCALAQVFGGAFRVHGAVRPFAETLLYSGFGHLDLTRIFLAGVFVAASGAVMDLAMDIAASMDEVRSKNPDLSTLAHIKSGMAVGRSVIGTMTTTLLLAYSGSYVLMLMLFVSQGIPTSNILNLNFVAAEVLNIMVGSFGLVTVAPFTALVGGVLYRVAQRPALAKA